MRVIHAEYKEELKVKKRKPNIVLGTFLILFIVYLVSFAMTAAPGTYAWLTSETGAVGTITNATTKDLLAFQSSEIKYGEGCSIRHTLKVKNISDMDTVVTVTLSASSGGETAQSKKLKPGQTLTVKPELQENSCETESLPYRIQAFHQYVDEMYSVPVDKARLKETMVPAVQEKPEVEQEEEKPEKEDKPPVEQPNMEKPEKEEVEVPKAEQPSSDTGQEGEPADALEGTPTEQVEDSVETDSEDIEEDSGNPVQGSSDNPDEKIVSEQKEE
ncbi:hypothetical protein [Rossellomorea aquimaris]|uniref:Uncharacterized protein n=1 Tax=Rossellomorea aquimaris TaxID=189382 RepID=A0A1J6VQQ5_9BACI|nr:hypothetical protein [Rossellomorea aquimaris]OIU67669.1 hypothetical protein BHE18_12630 [Rossellomorea aquimaris]